MNENSIDVTWTNDKANICKEMNKLRSIITPNGLESVDSVLIVWSFENITVFGSDQMFLGDDLVMFFHTINYILG